MQMIINDFVLNMMLKENRTASTVEMDIAFKIPQIKIRVYHAQKLRTNWDTCKYNEGNIFIKKT